MHRRGFTLIEMSVVIFVLALMAALVVPNMVAIQRSRALREREAALLRAPAEARVEAQRAGVPVALRIEDDDLVIERQVADGDPEEVRRVSLGQFEVESAADGSGATDIASWTWVVQPDGSAENGGLEFSEGENRRSLVLPATGPARWVSGELPNQSEERWPAGELEQRG